MKRTIKFRGLGIDGEIYYGDLIHVKGKPVIFGDTCEEVEPDSVAQLVGYDKSGREVYEGDTICGSSYRFKAELEPNANIHRFKLKETL